LNRELDDCRPGHSVGAAAIEHENSIHFATFAAEKVSGQMLIAYRDKPGEIA
jgi:hypothetical protein